MKEKIKASLVKLAKQKFLDWIGRVLQAAGQDAGPSSRGTLQKGEQK